MPFQTSHIFNCILSWYRYLKKLPDTRVAAKSITSKKYSLTNKYNQPVKLIIWILCFIFFMASSNHVICIEKMPGKGIARVHLQLYDCNYPQNNEAIPQKINLEAPHVLFADLSGHSSSCPDCQDEHIQFIASPASIDYSPAILLTTFLSANQNYLPVLHLSSRESSVQRLQYVPLSFYQLPVIRSTVLLI